MKALLNSPDESPPKCQHNLTECFICKPVLWELLGNASQTAADIAARATKSPNLTCFIDQFPLAMAAIAAVHDYERGPLVKGDYRPSLLRHLFTIGKHPDHEAAVAWNALAVLELRERARLNEAGR